MNIDLTQKEAKEIITGLIFLASPDIIHTDDDVDVSNAARLKLIKKISKTFDKPPELKSLTYYDDMVEFENKELLDKIRKFVSIKAETFDEEENQGADLNA